MVFFFLNAICISKVPGHYLNRKVQTSTARTTVNVTLKISKYLVIYQQIIK